MKTYMKYLKLYEDFMEGESLPGIDIPKDDIFWQQAEK